jgi:hypothetical protein
MNKFEMVQLLLVLFLYMIDYENEINVAQK